MDSMSSKMRLVFPASQLAKTSHASEADYDITKHSRTVKRQSRRKRMPRNEAGARRAMSFCGATLYVSNDDAGGDERWGTAANMQGGTR